MIRFWRQAMIEFLHKSSLRRENLNTGIAWVPGIWTKWGSHLLPQNYVCVREEKESRLNWLYLFLFWPSLIKSSSNVRLSPILTCLFLSPAIKELVTDANFSRLRTSWFTVVIFFPVLGRLPFFMRCCCCCDTSCWFFRYSMLKSFFLCRFE